MESSQHSIERQKENEQKKKYEKYEFRIDFFIRYSDEQVPGFMHNLLIHLLFNLLNINFILNIIDKHRIYFHINVFISIKPRPFFTKEKYIYISYFSLK